MKNIALIILAIGLSVPSFANVVEERDTIKTLITKNTRIGFNLAYDNFFTRINGEESFYSGGRGGFTFNNYLFVGMGGYGLINNAVLRDWILEGEDLYMESGFGGLIIEPTLFPIQPVHVTFPLMVGPGVAVFRERSNGYNWLDRDMFWAFNGGVQLEMNVTKWFRIGGGAHYMFTEGLNLPNTKSTFLDGTQYSLSLKLGKF
ncbi:MAG: hypothetical protein KDC92_15025 [Bacteroidetes bacterium]|nr:hypothetical protein [Bacteroidota bacterium]